MKPENKPVQKPVGTREWFDFIGMLSGTLPSKHFGGAEATKTLLELCRLEAASPLKEMGLDRLQSFMIQVYLRILLKLLRDARFRKAASIYDKITKSGKSYMGYTLIMGQKPG